MGIKIDRVDIITNMTTIARKDETVVCYLRDELTQWDIDVIRNQLDKIESLNNEEYYGKEVE